MEIRYKLQIFRLKYRKRQGLSYFRRSFCTMCQINIPTHRSQSPARVVDMCTTVPYEAKPKVPHSCELITAASKLEKVYYTFKKYALKSRMTLFKNRENVKNREYKELQPTWAFN